MARRCIDHGADLILVAGGDGTINEVVNGMVHSEVPLGLLPGGTANVLSMELGIGKKILAAARDLGNWMPERVALGLRRSPGMEPRYFLLMCGAGLDAHIVYRISVSLKNALGKVSYWVGGFSQLGRRFPEFQVEADGRLYKGSFALVSRVRNYGGDLEIARTVSLLDDRFELVLFSGNNSFRYLRYLLGVFRGSLASTRGVTVLQTTGVQLTCPEDDRIYTQLDGESAGRLPASLNIVPDSLTLLMPPKFIASRRQARNAEQAWTT
jgi:YegS/Rv2252/BmrU family lipid kinase